MSDSVQKKSWSVAKTFTTFKEANDLRDTINKNKGAKHSKVRYREAKSVYDVVVVNERKKQKKEANK